MAIARVQSKTGNSGLVGTGTLIVTLDVTPTAGNLLVCCAALGAAATQVVGITEATGLPWQFIRKDGATSTVLLFGIARVGSSAGAGVTVTSGLATAGIAMIVAEYSGGGFAPELSASATATSTSAASGATGTTGAATELWLGAIAARAAVGFSAPTNSFAIVGQDKSGINTANDRSACLLERIVSATGTANAGATISASNVWVARAFTFDVTGGSAVSGSSLRSSMIVPANKLT